MEEVFFGNVRRNVYDTGLCEADFVNNVIVNYRRVSGDSVTKFWIINGYESELYDLKTLDKNTIVFIFDERCCEYPEIVEQAGAVFQAYVSDRDLLGASHFCFPLGYNKIADKNNKKITNRKFSVFFIGNFHKGRYKFYKWLSGFYLPFAILVRMQNLLKLKFDKKFANSYIRFTNQFNTGLSADEYNYVLSESKIVLCPGGSVSVESFRLYEAMIQGCIVVTEKLPERAIFKGAPIIEIDNWKKAENLINNLLRDDNKLIEISNNTVAWYNNNVSPEAMGNYIMRKYKNK